MNGYRENNCKSVAAIPSNGVLFLGGHPNMVKKLQRIYPEWDYVTEDRFQRRASFNQATIFHWAGHSSHLMTKYVYSRAVDNVNILYVTATNLPLLLNEMNNAYTPLSSQ